MTERAHIPERLKEFILAEIEKLGYELVDMSTRGGKSFFLEIVIDKKGGITLEECGNFNKTVSEWMDNENMFNGSYTIDVCSPGLDRALINDKDYLWAVGKEIEIKTYAPVDSKNSFIGRLVRTDGEGNIEGIITEDANGKEVYIKKSNITKARLWVAL